MATDPRETIGTMLSRLEVLANEHRNHADSSPPGSLVRLRHERIAEAVDASAAALRAPERGTWQPIETAPKRGYGESPADVLLYGPELGTHTGRAAVYPDGFVFAGVPHIAGNISDGLATHWMEQPDPPVTRKEPS